MWLAAADRHGQRKADCFMRSCDGAALRSDYRPTRHGVRPPCTANTRTGPVALAMLSNRTGCVLQGSSDLRAEKRHWTDAMGTPRENSRCLVVRKADAYWVRQRPQSPADALQRNRGVAIGRPYCILPTINPPPSERPLLALVDNTLVE